MLKDSLWLVNKVHGNVIIIDDAFIIKTNLVMVYDLFLIFNFVSQF